MVFNAVTQPPAWRKALRSDGLYGHVLQPHRRHQHVWRAAGSSPPSPANPRLLVGSSAVVEPGGLFPLHEPTDE